MLDAGELYCYNLSNWVVSVILITLYQIMNGYQHEYGDGLPWLVLVIRGLNLINGFKFKRKGGEFNNNIGNQTVY